MGCFFRFRQTIAAVTVFVLGTMGVSAEVTRFPAPQQESETLSIHAAIDLQVLEPLVRDFQSLFPSIGVEIIEYVTNDLSEAVIQACISGKPLGDIVLSSSVGQLVKLANDGCAQAHPSGSTELVPHWANWRDEVFGFTMEPVVFVYNRTLVPPADVPLTHPALADLLRTRLDFYRDRVGTYDIRESGIGYLLAFYDSRQATATYGRLLESLGRAKAKVHCCATELMDDLIAGRILIAYNVLVSSAYRRIREGAPLGIVIPEDYTLVLSRGALLPRYTKTDHLGRRFLDYLLSYRGQDVARDSSVPLENVDSQAPVMKPSLRVLSSGIARPIAIGPGLLAAQDITRQTRFIKEWEESVVGRGK